MELGLRFCLTSLVHDHAWWSDDQILQTPGVRLVAVADEHIELHEKMRQKLGDAAEYYTDVGERLDCLAL
jgi:hypothetical protein